MSIKQYVQIDAADWQKHIQFFSTYSVRLDRELAPGMKRTVKFAYDYIYQRVPEKTGWARNNLRDNVFGYGKTMTGVVGWRGRKGGPYYVNVLEHGARKHTLTPRGNSGSQKQRARREASLEKRLAKGRRIVGQHIFNGKSFITIAVHPGVSKLGFMAAGYSATIPFFTEEMRRAANLMLEGINQ